MRRYYHYRLSGDQVTLRTRDDVAKQGLWGWASDRDAVDMSLYGREERIGRGWWQWRLGPGAVERMTENVERHVEDRRYYNQKEARRARELLAVFRMARGHLRRSR